MFFRKVIVKASDKRVAEEEHLVITHGKVGRHDVGVVTERTDPCASCHAMLLVAAGVDWFLSLYYPDSTENANVGGLWSVSGSGESLLHDGFYLGDTFLPW